MIMEGTRPPTGASPTQPYKCGQYVKVKIKTARAAVGADNICPYTINNNAVLTLTF
jgi:hypothetical protein